MVTHAVDKETAMLLAQHEIKVIETWRGGRHLHALLVFPDGTRLRTPIPRSRGLNRRGMLNFISQLQARVRTGPSHTQTEAQK